MSIISANKFKTLDGTTWNVPVQVVTSSLGTNLGTTSNDQTNANASWSISTTATTWTDTSNLQLTMTPKFTNSLIRLELSIYSWAGGSGRGVAVRVIRGSTILYRPLIDTTGPYGMNFGDLSAHHFTSHLVFFDTPNTISPITYSLQYRTYNGVSAARLFGLQSATSFSAANYLVATEFAQ